MRQLFINALSDQRHSWKQWVGVALLGLAGILFCGYLTYDMVQRDAPGVLVGLIGITVFMQIGAFIFTTLVAIAKYGIDRIHRLIDDH